MLSSMGCILGQDTKLTDPLLPGQLVKSGLQSSSIQQVVARTVRSCGLFLLIALSFHFDAGPSTVLRFDSWFTRKFFARSCGVEHLLPALSKASKKRDKKQGFGFCNLCCNLCCVTLFHPCMFSLPICSSLVLDCAVFSPAFLS